jgi:hypothetical protein
VPARRIVAYGFLVLWFRFVDYDDRRGAGFASRPRNGRVGPIFAVDSINSILAVNPILAVPIRVKQVLDHKARAEPTGAAATAGQGK